MEDSRKIQIAYADAVIHMLWAAGLLTDQECKQISDRTANALKIAE